METKLIANDADLASAKDFFNGISNWTNEIDEAVEGKKLPYLLIASYSEDVDFGNIYRFIAVDKGDLTAGVPIIKTGEPQRKANARLIAAAPDMYELLQRISDQPNDEIGTLRDEAVGIINKINQEQ